MSLIQLNPAYESADSITDLVKKGFLHALCDKIFHDGKQSIQLYRHQQDAIMKALNDQHFIVTSGTGSGKSLTYLIPIFDCQWHNINGSYALLVKRYFDNEFSK